VTLVFLFLLAGAVSAGITWLLFSSSIKRYLMDHPNERSLHDFPKPRIGGIGICAGVLLAFVAMTMSRIELPEAFAYVAAGAIIVLVISFVDDLKSLSVALRIPFHFLAAGALLVAGLSLQKVIVSGVAVGLPYTVGVVVSVLYVVWMVNLYNFMDGMDGFAGGMAVIGFGVLALLAADAGSVIIAATSGSIAGAALGFLPFNFPPARVFMGDVGSSTLGFLAAGLSLWADWGDVVPLWISLLIFSPFIADATVTLFRRALNKEPVWRAHRSHYYQKLVRLGWGHRKTVICEYMLMIGCGASGYLAMGLESTGQWIVLTFWVIAYAVLMLSIHRLEHKKGVHGSAETV
jgi:UDP-N-acetylmuramyl pentapeptide phosphotransferase/UDP-N-acetylglucosamine-1-phosphate transferase